MPDQDTVVTGRRRPAMTRQRLWIAAGAGLLLVVTAGLAAARPQEPPEREFAGICGAALGLRQRQLIEPLTDGDRTIAVLGDSYTQGQGLSGPEKAWPAVLGELLGAEVVLDGVGSTGFTTVGMCAPAEVSFAQRLEADPPDADVVVVQGGVNDAILGRPEEVADAAGDLLEKLEDVDTVVVVGPVAVPVADAADLAAIDAALQQATDDAGRVYLPLLNAGVALLDDFLHPTVAGQRWIAELVAAEIEAADTER